MKKLFLVSVVGLVFAQSCKHTLEYPPITPEPTVRACDPDTVYFERDILPILVSNCVMSGCHDAASAQNGVILDTYQNVYNTADVRPGDAGGSDLYEVLVDPDPSKRMPMGMPALPPDQIALIQKWINQGAENLFCDDTTACDTSAVSFASHITPILQNACVGCHGAGNTTGITLTSHADVVASTSNGRLLGAITHAGGFSPMPKGGNKLPSCDISKIRTWINDGTPNN